MEQNTNEKIIGLSKSQTAKSKRKSRGCGNNFVSYKGITYKNRPVLIQHVCEVTPEKAKEIAYKINYSSNNQNISFLEGFELYLQGKEIKKYKYRIRGINFSSVIDAIKYFFPNDDTNKKLSLINQRKRRIKREKNLRKLSDHDLEICFNDELFLKRNKTKKNPSRIVSGVVNGVSYKNTRTSEIIKDQIKLIGKRGIELEFNRLNPRLTQDHDLHSLSDREVISVVEELLKSEFIEKKVVNNDNNQKKERQRHKRTSFEYKKKEDYIKPKGKYCRGAFASNPELRANNSTLYLIRIKLKDKHYLKFGITTQTIHQRFSSHIKDIEVLMAFKGGLYRNWLVENAGHGYLSLTRPNIVEINDFDGKTEIYEDTKENLEAIKHFFADAIPQIALN